MTLARRERTFYAGKESAVSEIIGSVMLISIVVAAISIVGVILWSQPPPESIPVLSAGIANQSCKVIVSHNGGDTLEQQAFQILVDGTDKTASFLKNGNPVWTSWSIGDTLTYTDTPCPPMPQQVQVIYTGGTGVLILSQAQFVGSGTVIPYSTPMPPPAVTSILPASGPTTGGTPVAITGTGFTGATAVMFGGTAAASYTVNSDTSISATSPAGSGTVDITVTTPAGTSAISVNDQYTYAAIPTVTGRSPTAGPTAGGTPVAITGTEFSGATAVMFGGTAAASYTVNSDTSISATSPAGSAGTVDITVTTPGGTSAISGNDQYTYAAVPTVTGRSPTAGPTAGGTVVTVTGTGFTGANNVKFGATANATGAMTVDSDTQITVTSPAGSAGTVDITVTTPGGTSAISVNDQYNYVAAPTYGSLLPVDGPVTGGTSVTITGTNLALTTGVTFGGTAGTITGTTATTVTVTTPVHAAGAVNVVITTPGGTATGTNAYTYYTFKIETFTTVGTTSWTVPSGVTTVEYLVVAGGGGGGRNGGGGGAGGVLTGTLTGLSSSYTVTVGTGGAGATSSTVRGASGSNSVFGSYTATGGGGGGSSGAAGVYSGAAGGSGGGGTRSAAGGSGSQGSNGGAGATSGTNYLGGGGGGNTGVGVAATTTAGGSGGGGITSSISGSSLTYACGGGGGAPSGGGRTAGSAGCSISGDGGLGVVGSNAAANYGGGGGGSGATNRAGGNGGSGIVILRYY